MHLPLEKKKYGNNVVVVLLSADPRGGLPGQVSVEVFLLTFWSRNITFKF